jgi:integrase
LAEGKVGYQNTSIFDKAGSQKDGKSDSLESASASPPCPQCASTRLYRDGLRYLADGSSVQRWLCRDCAYRFSEKPPQKNLKWQINTPNTLTSRRRICANRKEAKNLTTAAETKTVAGDAKPQVEQQTRKGLIINFMLYMKKQGFRPSTIKNRAELIKTLLNQDVDLNNPEDVKFAIADKKCGDGYKKNLVLAYDTLLKMQGKKWDAPKYKPPDRLPFIPLESEIDQLINSVGRSISLFLHVLKETGADPGEALAIEWIDIDRNSKTITINHPVKGHKARIITIPKELQNRLDALPKTTDTVFNVKMRTLLKNYYMQRQTAARKFANPRLRKITFTTFRHWKATMEYHKTKDILWVMHLLGHNSLKTTLIYIDLETALFREANDEFTVRVANTLDEASELLEVGFEYVCEMEGKTLFKKRK